MSPKLSNPQRRLTDVKFPESRVSSNKIKNAEKYEVEKDRGRDTRRINSITQPKTSKASKPKTMS